MHIIPSHRLFYFISQCQQKKFVLSKKTYNKQFGANRFSLSSKPIHAKHIINVIEPSEEA